MQNPTIILKMKEAKQDGFSPMLALLALALLAFAVACTQAPYGQDGTGTSSGTQQLKKFSSSQEILNYIKSSQLNAQYSGAFYDSRMGIGIAAAEESAGLMAKAAGSAESPGAADYSTTNIQVEGVDEADIVKNDGKYIYTITQNKLVIVDAYPAEDARIISETKISGRPRNMLVNGDRLVLFAEEDAQIPVFAQYDFLPRPRYGSVTHAYIYDISGREKPELVNDYNIDGYYVESRMIDDYVYLVARDDVYYYAQAIDLPAVREGSSIAIRPDIYYFDNPEYNYNFHTIASFNILEDDGKVNAQTFMMGYSGAIYVSENNIYITYQKNLPYSYYDMHNEERFYDVVLPLLPSDAKSGIEGIKNDNSLDAYEKWAKISAVLEEMYNSMDENEKDALIKKIQEAVNEYELKLDEERRKTVIHRIAIANGNIDYGSRGEVPGYLLNQFSMDEDEDYFRVATTTEAYGYDRSIMHNNVYVLDKSLDIVGKLEKIAPDERIYSTRFIGDRLYMVTFQRIDPLFVIDLSDPQQPEILGELKIPGFSDYLHPYDESHIISIGKETGSNEWGGVSVKGVKLALFDVSDVSNPKQLDQYEIGEAGTDSEALRDHKAFLFDKEKSLLVIPVSEIKGREIYDPRYGYYRQSYWQGAYAFRLTEDGFELKGKVTHDDNDETTDYYYYGSPNAVRRSLFMDDVLYTVSEAKIKANSLDDVSSEISEIKLPYEQPVYPYPVPYYGKTAEGDAGVAMPSSPEAVK